MSNNESGFENKSGSLFSQKWNVADEQSADDQPLQSVSVLAILSLVGGFLSFAVFFSLYFLFIPAITLFLVVLALIKIKRSDGTLIGRNFALLGLWLLLIPGISKPMIDYIYLQNLYKNGEVFFQYWFETAKKGDFVKLQQLQSGMALRNPVKDEAGFWKTFIKEEEMHDAMHRFLTNKTLLTLATLGDKAQCRLYRTDAHGLSMANDETLVQTYAITYPKADGEKETFFIALTANRSFINNSDFDKKKYTWVVESSSWIPLKLDDQKKPVSPLAKKG